MPTPTNASSSGQKAVPVAPIKQSERMAKRLWMTVVIGLLGTQICIGGTAIYLANSDSTVTVIPDYYQSAVNWDTTRRARQNLRQLGWQVDVSVPQSEGTRFVILQILDPDGEPVTDLGASAECFHFAEASRIDSLQFRELGSGKYQAGTKLSKRGRWQVTLRLEGKHGIAEMVREIDVK